MENHLKYERLSDTASPTFGFIQRTASSQAPPGVLSQVHGCRWRLCRRHQSTGHSITTPAQTQLALDILSCMAARGTLAAQGTQLRLNVLPGCTNLNSQG